MSRYRFQVSDYHAIRQASVDIEGITVLAGENGSGKSTLARWLYYVLNVATDFETYLVEDYAYRIREVLRIVSRIGREMGLKSGIGNFVVLRNLSFEEPRLEKVGEGAHAYVDKIVSALSHFFSSDEVAEVRKQRVLSYLATNSGEHEESRILDSFANSCHARIDRICQEFREEVRERRMDKLYQVVRKHLGEEDEAPQDMNLLEDGVELLCEGRMGTFLNVDRAIYVDTPTVVGGTDLGNVFWEKLREMMMKPVNGKEFDGSGDGVRFLKMMLGRILRGKVEVKKEDFFENSELFYEREDGLSVELGKVATGMKSFAYLLQLVSNGYLDQRTILLIDEPEAHLHPQWIVEFAKVLVFLNVKLGVKIMVASHNPDMVAAIRAIAKRHKVADKVHFYLTERDKNDEFRYVFHDLGDSVEPIFESFNIALSRIQQYGDSNI